MSDNFITHDVSVAGLATAGSIAGTDFLLANIGGVHKKVTVASVASGESAVTSVTASSPLASSGGATPNLTLASAVAATLGGTGQSSYAVGDLLYASTTTALSKLADVATGQVLASGGIGVAPAYTATPAISGASITAGSIPSASLATVAITNGGTGQTTSSAALNALGVTAGGSAESQTIGSTIVKRGTTTAIDATGVTPTAVAFGAAFTTAVDNIQLTVRSHTSSTLKILAAYPTGASITTAGFDISVFGGDGASTASVDWVVRGH